MQGFGALHFSEFKSIEHPLSVSPIFVLNVLIILAILVLCQSFIIRMADCSMPVSAVFGHVMVWKLRKIEFN